MKGPVNLSICFNLLLLITKHTKDSSFDLANDFESFHLSQLLLVNHIRLGNIADQFGMINFGVINLLPVFNLLNLVSEIWLIWAKFDTEFIARVLKNNLNSSTCPKIYSILKTLIVIYTIFPQIRQLELLYTD